MPRGSTTARGRARRQWERHRRLASQTEHDGKQGVTRLPTNGGVTAYTGQVLKNDFTGHYLKISENHHKIQLSCKILRDGHFIYEDNHS